MWVDIWLLGVIISSSIVVSANNPVIAVLSLIVLFILVALELIVIGASFLGWSLIIVYIGAIAILFLFVVIILDVSLFDNKTRSRGGYWNIGLDLVLLGPLWLILLKIVSWLIEDNQWYKMYVRVTRILYKWGEEGKEQEMIHVHIWKDWDSILWDWSEVTELGIMMYNNELVWFVVLTGILLLGIVGPILLTLKNRW